MIIENIRKYITEKEADNVAVICAETTKGIDFADVVKLIKSNLAAGWKVEILKPIGGDFTTQYAVYYVINVESGYVNTRSEDGYYVLLNTVRNCFSVAKREPFHALETLSNGAVVIDWHTKLNGDTFVLCSFRGDYVTWYVSPHDRSTHHGHYFGNFLQAVADYKTRIGHTTNL